MVALKAVILNAGNGVVVVDVIVDVGAVVVTVAVAVVDLVVDVVVIEVVGVAVEDVVRVVSPFLPHEISSPLNKSERTNIRASRSCNVLEVFIICLSCAGPARLNSRSIQPSDSRIILSDNLSTCQSICRLKLGPISPSRSDDF